MNHELLKKKLELHAEQNDFRLNPNEKLLKALLNKLVENKEEHGEFYCPCRVKLSADFICPCKGHVADVNEKGHCHCLLFVK